ncbi:hypothetical protein GCM10011494_00720 [Novosphingobium endophyticum]|uniref:Uncharacterized protein n=2 Tax=Novosphingobium endophyticum TaxID=1955250 RepID=A0A916X2M8_9SPHN|nr:hypothetical protein GCM10011494_00720 [Novosphingobium endophyticum]
MRAGSLGLSNALAPQITSFARSAAKEPAGIVPEITPRAVARNFIGNPHFVASKSSQDSAHGPVIRTTVPQGSERTPVDRGAPLDAVRIVLPPATMEHGLTGVMQPEATLGSDAATDREPSTPAPHPDAQPLAVSSSPQVLAVPAPGALSQSKPFSLSSAPEEVRKFDLARIGPGNPEAKSLARASANALAATAGRSSPRTPDLPRVARVPDRIVGDHIIHVAALSLEGVPSGNLSVRIGMSGDLSVRLSDLLAPVRTQMAPDTFERMAGSTAASEYVSFADLRAAGFDIRYEAGGDRLMVSAQL